MAMTEQQVQLVIAAQNGDVKSFEALFAVYHEKVYALARMIIGQDNKKVIPVSMIIGAIFLIIVDTISRNLTGAEIPLSIITGFVGTPFFVFVLFKQKKRG